MFSDPEFQDKLKALLESRDSEQSAMEGLSPIGEKIQTKETSSWEELQNLLQDTLRPPDHLAISPRLQQVLNNWDPCVNRVRELGLLEELRQLRTALLSWNEQGETAKDELDALERRVEDCLWDGDLSESSSPVSPRIDASLSIGRRQRALMCLIGQIRAAARAEKPALADAASQAAWVASPAQRTPTEASTAKHPEMRAVAVMFTDMAGSTEFAETFGSVAAYEKRERHNQLLLPLIEQHSGTLVQIIGDALLVIFDEAADAARCAIAMHRRLAEYNRSDHLDVEALEIHIRIGIHHGKAIVFREQGHVELAGRAVNMAARVESGGGKQTDQILISEAMLSQLLPFEEFATEPATVVEAKGIARPIQLHRLLWNDEAVRAWKESQIVIATKPAQVLAAASAERLAAEAEEDSNTRGCHCLFVDPGNGRGYVVPVWVRVASENGAVIRSKTDCDRVMVAAGERAIRSAFDALPTIGFRDARIEEHAIEWWIDVPDVRFEGASLGLAITLATVAAYTGTQIDPETAVTGAVDGRQVVSVAGIGNKWTALRDSGRFQKLILPSDNWNDLPAEARRDHRLRVIHVPDVESAVIDVLGPSLGIGANRLAAATELPEGKKKSGEIDVELWIQPEAKRALTRDIRIAPEEDVHNWFIGQKIRFCAQVNRDCHLSLINIGATGNVTILIPNSLHPETAARANEVVTFPSPQDRFLMELLGPPGRERVIAIASDQPLKLRPEDFDQSGKIVYAQPTTRDIAIVAENLSLHELARCEIDFYVSERDASPRGPISYQFRSLE